jgi:PDZ domain-containing protein
MRYHEHMIRKLTISALIGLTIASGAVMAQDASQSEERLYRLVGLLDDPSWVVREQSTQMIGNPNEGFELSMLAMVLEREDLSEEAKTRLWIAARELFGRTTKAGLGVGFGAMRDGGVEIRTVVQEMDQFPAATMLVPGDLIVGADGHTLTDSDDLRAMILSHDPGETLNAIVQRGDRVLDLDLPLGSYQFLRGAAPISPHIADRAVKIRWARQGIVLPEIDAIGEGIEIGDWISAGYPEEPGSFRASNARRDPRVVNAGAGRDVHVGVGTITRGRIEPWSNMNNAEDAMVQARQIELSKELNIVRLRLQLLKGGIKEYDRMIIESPDDESLKEKLSTAMRELRSAQKQLELLTDEFETLRVPDDQDGRP